MKANRFILLTITFCTLLISCGKDKYSYPVGKDISGDDSGNIEISLKKSLINVTKISENDLDVNNFKVEIFTDKDVRIRSWKSYSEVKGTKFKLNEGNYRLLAFYGDSTKTGFNSIYFAGTELFSVEQGKTTSIEATCKMAKVKMCVVTTDAFKSLYKDYTVKAFRKGFNDTLVFSKNEMRSGYIPAGTLDFKIHLIDNNDKVRVYSPKSLECNPNEFVTLKLDSDGTAEFDVAATFVIDTETDNRTINLIIPGTLRPQSAPVVYADFKPQLSFVEGAAPKSTLVIQAEGYVASAVLTTDSEQLKTLGFGDNGIDLAALTPNEESKLLGSGLTWSAEFNQRQVAEINLSGLLSKLKYDEQNKTHSITLKVTDRLGQKLSKTLRYEFSIIKVLFNIDLPAYDVWSKFAYVTVESNMPEDGVSLEVKQSDWSAASYELYKKDGNKYIYKVNNLLPDNSYTFRAKCITDAQTIYSGEKTCVTEKASGLPNAGFENWTDTKLNGGNGTWSTAIYNFEVNGWATRNSRTTKGAEKGSGWSNYCTYYRWYNGTVKTNSCTEGVAAAEISTLAFYNQKVSGVWSDDDVLQYVRNDGTAYEGYLFLGTFDKNSDSYTLGISHADRPLSISFDYKYAPIEADKAIAFAKVYDASGSVIAETEEFNSETINDFKNITLSFIYRNEKAKAAKIAVFFQSGTNVDKNKMNLVPGSYSASPKNKHRVVGSVFTVDNVKLNY